MADCRPSLRTVVAHFPNPATLQRALHTLDVPALEQALGRWQQQMRRGWARFNRRWLDGIAIDGKTVRGAKRLGAAHVHLLSACYQQRGVLLGEVPVADTTNEAGALPALLAQLLLTDETVPFDAAFTQVTVAEQLVRHGGAYHMIVKGNQPARPRAGAEATTLPLVRPCRQLGQAHSVQVGHGRIDQRTLTVAVAPSDLGWPHALRVLRVHFHAPAAPGR